MFSMLVNTLGEIGCYTDIQRSVSLAGEYINGRLHHVSVKKTLIRHSRVGGNLGLNLSDFQKYLEIPVISNFWIPAYAGMTD